MKHLRRLGTIFALAVLGSAALAMASAPAHASECEGTLVVSLEGCVSVGGVAVTTTKPEPPPRPDVADKDPGDFTRITEPPAAPPKHRATPRVAPRTAAEPVVPIRIHSADIDLGFMSGTYERELPYSGWSWAKRLQGGTPSAATPSTGGWSARELVTPLRIAAVYAGLLLLAGALGVRKLLVTY